MGTFTSHYCIKNQKRPLEQKSIITPATMTLGCHPNESFNSSEMPLFFFPLSAHITSLITTKRSLHKANNHDVAVLHQSLSE
jgi:hypothetical protein